ncbi:MAG: hypothetical protein MUQ10_18725 [Anaerolineae bacterium]|nr:hypothetical protein [Anaerolineae bacterium]
MGKLIAAICHGPQAPAAGPDVATGGGEYVSVPMDEADVEGCLVTSPVRPAHPEWPAKFLQVLGTTLEPQGL